LASIAISSKVVQVIESDGLITDQRWEEVSHAKFHDKSE